MITENNLLMEFEALMDDKKTSEQSVHNFLERNTRLFYAPFQLNHDVHLKILLSKFRLDTTLTTDFAYLTKSSAVWWLVFVELEKPDKRLFTNKPQPSADLTAAIQQVSTWRTLIEKTPDDIVRRIAPLKRPLSTNKLKFKYALIIGRTTEFEQNQEKVDAFETLQRDDFKILTYDSLIHSYEAEPNTVLDIFSQKGNKFAFKHRNCPDSRIFSWLTPNDVHLEREDVAHYESRGYDIQAWLRGELLTCNGKLSGQASGSALSKALTRTRTFHIGG